MKLKLRHQNTTIVLNFENLNSSNLTLEDVCNKISRETQILGNFHLSLNNRDGIQAEKSTHLSELGIVAGDLLFLITDQTDVFQSAVHSSCSTGQATPSSGSGTSSAELETTTLGDGGVTDEAENKSYINDDCSTNETNDKMTINKLLDNISKETTDVAVMRFDPVVNKCLNEPLLCSESTSEAVPAAVNHLFVIANCTSKEDALWIVIHALMLETGYHLVQEEEETGDYLALPVGWQSRGFYRFQYTHCHTDNLACSVTGVPMGMSLVVHGLVEGSSKLQTQQVQLKTSEFVTDNFTDAVHCYRNLDKLSRQIKDKICLPLVNAVRAELGLPDCEGLLALTHELQLKIFSYLDAFSALKIDQTCRQCHVVARDPYLWRRFYLRDFGRIENLSLCRPWYELYKDEYKRQDEKRKALNRMLTPPPLLWGPPQPIRDYVPFYPPEPPHGIIGGDYDLHPPFFGIPGPPGFPQPGPSRFPHPFAPDHQGPPRFPNPRFDPFDPTYNEMLPGQRFPRPGFGARGNFRPRYF